MLWIGVNLLFSPTQAVSNDIFITQVSGIPNRIEIEAELQYCKSRVADGLIKLLYKVNFCNFQFKKVLYVHLLELPARLKLCRT